MASRTEAGESAFDVDVDVNVELLESLHKISARYCLEEGGSHGPDHSERVFHLAMTIGRRMDARLDIIAPATLLHDIGRKQESSSQGKICHAELGAKMAEPLLHKLWLFPSRPESNLPLHLCPSFPKQYLAGNNRGENPF